MRGTEYGLREILASIRSDPFQAAHLAVYERASSRLVGKTVLDLGCGYGWGSRILAQTARSVVGVDIQADRISLARQLGTPLNLSFVTGSLPELQLPHRFDSVCLVQVLQYLSDPAELLVMAGELLLASGQLLIAVKPSGRWTGMEASALCLAVSQLLIQAGMEPLTTPLISTGERDGSPLLVELWVTKARAGCAIGSRNWQGA